MRKLPRSLVTTLLVGVVGLGVVLLLAPEGRSPASPKCAAGPWHFGADTPRVKFVVDKERCVVTIFVDGEVREAMSLEGLDPGLIEPIVMVDDPRSVRPPYKPAVAPELPPLIMLPASGAR